MHHPDIKLARIWVSGIKNMALLLPVKPS